MMEGNAPIFIPAQLGKRPVFLPYQEGRRMLVGVRGYKTPNLHFVCSFCETLFSVNCSGESDEAVTIVEVRGIPHAACAACACGRDTQGGAGDRSASQQE